MELYLVFLLLVSLLFALLIQQAAKLRGRNPKLWFVLGICFGLIALVALYLLPQKPLKEEDIAIPIAVNQAVPEEPMENEPFFESPKNNDSSYWYFINQDKKTIGPMSFEHLCQEYLAGKLQQKTYIWADHMTDWQRLESMSNLFADLSNYRPPEPPAKKNPEQPTNN